MVGPGGLERTRALRGPGTVSCPRAPSRKPPYTPLVPRGPTTQSVVTRVGVVGWVDEDGGEGGFPAWRRILPTAGVLHEAGVWGALSHEDVGRGGCRIAARLRAGEGLDGLGWLVGANRGAVVRRWAGEG